MRLSDILKKHNQQAKPAQPGTKQEPVKNEQVVTVKTAKLQVPPSLISKIPILAPEETYKKSVNEIKSIIEHIDRGDEFPNKIESVQELIELVEDRNEDISILADKATPDLYLYSHSVNVCIFTLILGKQMGLSGDNLKELGYSSFLHDIGMIKHMNTVQKKGRLTAAEFNLVKKHPMNGHELVRMLANISPEIKDIAATVISHIHERVNGAGYPTGLKGKDIHVLARMTAIGDVYEALTHPRPYRDRYIPHEALKLMITSADTDFDADLLKAFIETISLYPPGSYVRLNSDDIARVIKLNQGLPTRPVVRVIANAKGQKVTETKIIDLSAISVLFIKEAIDETKLESIDKRLALELKAVRWWVKGL
ncbi:MAG: HD-GYP domain-containing protein [Elusimicrobiota bacterium]